MLDSLKLNAEYYLTTANGLITTGLVIGFFQMLFTENQIMFIVFLATWLLRDSRREAPAVVVISKEQFEKEQDDYQ